ncbi:MAG: glycosyltransferase family 2 protein [Elusimicrobia bacterium]|nr:glycosyltransferase family 2 protein [Elusimicrobiota bacterium]
MPESLCVVVPVYNEEDNIVPFYERAKPVLEATGLAWSVVFVNDGSRDASLERILALRNKDPRVKVLTLSRNFGYHSVLVAGLTRVEADLYAIIDVDCEDPPEVLAGFYEEIKKGARTAYGIRSKREEPAWVIFFRWLFYKINSRIADGPIRDWMAEFSMFTRVVRDAILDNTTTFPFLRAEMGLVGLRMAGVSYTREKRRIGKSHYNFLTMARFAVGGFLASSTFPLRWILYLSMAMTAGYSALVLALGLNLAQSAQTAGIFSFFFLMLTVPMLSLYLARTYKNVSGRPVYYVDPESTYL